MTYFHYYATTSRNLDRVLQYGVYPVSQALGIAISGKVGIADKKKRLQFSSDFARVTSAVAYSMLTTAFFGLESELIDANGREAVSAEMGIDPARVDFSDYKYSKNVIISKAYKDIIRLQKYRYGTDMLFVLPTLLRLGSKAMGIGWPDGKDVEENFDKYGLKEQLQNGHVGWNMSVYAGKAAYWAGETFLVPKTGNYEIVKLRENLQSTSKDISANDIFAVYQRTRTDRGLPIIENDSATEHQAIWPLLQRMADAYNKHDGTFGVSEMVYLIGLGKINIHAPDNVTVSNDAITQSQKEIDKVLAIGLNGIREENRKHSSKGSLDHKLSAKHSKSFVDNISDGAFNIVQKVLRNNQRSNKHAIKTEEYISARDPGELTNWNYSVNR